MHKKAIKAILINLLLFVLILIIIIYLLNEYYKETIISTKFSTDKKEYKIKENTFDNKTNIEETQNNNLQESSNTLKKYPKEEIIENYNRI